MALSDDILLGKDTAYSFDYDPSLLFPVPRAQGRSELSINTEALPFFGFDRWTAYEVSWLNSDGMPQVAIVDFLFECTSENLVESKSFKLYLNSFNQTVMESVGDLVKVLEKDLSVVSGGNVTVNLFGVDDYAIQADDTFKCLDEISVKCTQYEPDARLLAESVDLLNRGHYRLKSHLLRSLCPVTGQPDWATVFIEYRGGIINESQLLAYIVSYRNHQGFHEQCVEQIYQDISKLCKPDALSVYARYTRRGGLDINPWRANSMEFSPAVLRTSRQ
ncbi:NADPH-dependent 7-cyano-7-deazaguanine reductase [BD1-7 clade bacterium]|uniref:NADPH-dependent 7-cyano-7-deazaguanine reductase n=1 Tax=BD1-7 clade bacterium TaxID=2029982 RepID=A0A5S9Q2M3_9GAMM|nr:NADPH-dependent 7-cyano-7-deazaguanine reductase [BD1-7 clade bacterium]CAA0112030.1 NADPH-dependent 7-cyano-7-deazaguanine reductase [BD1-7 clade bacterium]